MPFVKHVVDDSPTAGVSGLSVALRKGKRDAVAKMIVFLTEKVCAELAWPVGSVLEVHIGTDTDHGMLRLRKNADAVGGAKVVSAGKGKFARIEVSLGFVPGFVDRDEQKQPCNYEDIGEGGTVEIVLPAWAEETHPTKPKVAIPPPAVERKPLVSLKPRPVLGQRMTATHNFGDPPLHRSALVAGASERMQEQERLKVAEREARKQEAAVVVSERRSMPPKQVQPGPLPAGAMKMLRRLSDGQVHTYDDLHKAMESNAATPKLIVQVTISNNREKFAAIGVEILQVAGAGCQIKPECLAAAKKAVGEEVAA